MILSTDTIPFDNAPYRAIRFSCDTVQNLEKAREELKNTVQEIIKPDFVMENPITHARGLVEFKKHASSTEQVLADELQAVKRRLDALEQDKAARDTGVVPSPMNYLNALRDFLPPDAATNDDVLRGRKRGKNPPFGS
jgi:hypothetical protein